MRKTEPAKADVAVVKIDPVPFRQVKTIDPKIDDHATCTSQFVRCFHYVRRSPHNHRNQFRQWNGRNQRVISGATSVCKVKRLGRRIQPYESMSQVDLRPLRLEAHV